MLSEYATIRVATVAIVLLIADVAIAGQDALKATKTDLPAELDDLKAPSSPAFVLLGVSPTKVERPQAVKPLVLSAVTASSDGFPKNYAVEFTPYWLGSPKVSFSDYYNSGVAKAIPRHLSISIASTPLGERADAGTSLALGLRTLPLPGRKHPRLDALVGTLDRQQKAVVEAESLFSRPTHLLALIQAAHDLALDGANATLQADPFKTLVDRAIALTDAVESVAVNEETTERDRKTLSDAEYKARLADIEKQKKENEDKGKALAADTLAAVERHTTLEQRLATESKLEGLLSRVGTAHERRVTKGNADLKATALKIQALDRQRVGMTMSVAAAAAWDVPNDVTDHARLAKLGLWVTPGYRVLTCPTDVTRNCSQPVDILGVLRFLEDRRTGSSERTVEVGARIVWQSRSNLALSGEWLGRTSNNGLEPGTRLVGVAEYEISSSAFLYASFGRDFEERGVRRNLVSTIGITFGFGKRPILTSDN